MTLALDDDLFDAQFVRALAYTAQAGADVGECFATAERITKTDGDLWYEQWFATAERVYRLAETSAAERWRSRRLEARARSTARRRPPTR